MGGKPGNWTPASVTAMKVGRSQRQRDQIEISAQCSQVPVPTREGMQVRQNEELERSLTTDKAHIILERHLPRPN